MDTWQAGGSPASRGWWECDALVTFSRARSHRCAGGSWQLAQCAHREQEMTARQHPGHTHTVQPDISSI